MLNVKKALTKLASGFVEVRTANVEISHGAIAGNSYGAISFSAGSQTGEMLIAMTPISFDPALQLTCYYANGGWHLSYYNAYSGTASAGKFEVRVTHVKVGGGYFLTALSAIFSRLAERWWEYVESKETQHQTVKQPTSRSRRNTERDILGGQIGCRHNLHTAYRSKSIAWSIERQTKSRLGKCRYISDRRKFVQNIIQQHFFKCNNGRRETQSPLYYLTISERGWSCA